MSLKIAFSYPSTAPVPKEFRVYQVDSVTRARLSAVPALCIPPASIPTITAPATVPVSNSGISMLEVVAYDGTQEGISAYVLVYIQLPAVTAIAVVGQA